MFPGWLWCLLMRFWIQPMVYFQKPEVNLISNDKKKGSDHHRSMLTTVIIQTEHWVSLGHFLASNPEVCTQVSPSKSKSPPISHNTQCTSSNEHKNYIKVISKEHSHLTASSELGLASTAMITLFSIMYRLLHKVHIIRSNFTCRPPKNSNVVKAQQSNHHLSSITKSDIHPLLYPFTLNIIWLAIQGFWVHPSLKTWPEFLHNVDAGHNAAECFNGSASVVSTARPWKCWHAFH